MYANGRTDEWCIIEKDGVIQNVTVGGNDSWIMLGHVFWSQEFSKKFLAILENEYNNPETMDKLWETIYIEHIDELQMNIRKYPSNFIFEFDTLDELRIFDQSYTTNTRSEILKKIATNLGISERQIEKIKAFKDKNNAAAGFTFHAGQNYKYYYATQKLEEI